MVLIMKTPGSDILSVKEHNGMIELLLFGDRDLAGEIVLEGDGVSRIRPAATGMEKPESTLHGEQLVIHYDHPHRKEFILKLSTA